MKNILLSLFFNQYTFFRICKEKFNFLITDYGYRISEKKVFSGGGYLIAYSGKERVVTIGFDLLGGEVYVSVGVLSNGHKVSEMYLQVNMPPLRDISKNSLYDDIVCRLELYSENIQRHGDSFLRGEKEVIDSLY